MPRVKQTKSGIDALRIPPKDTVYWDANCPGFGVKVTPTGRKVFVVLYRTAGAGSRLRKYTIGTFGRITLNQARVTAPEGVRSQTRRTRSRCGEERLSPQAREPADGWRYGARCRG